MRRAATPLRAATSSLRCVAGGRRGAPGVSARPRFLPNTASLPCQSQSLRGSRALPSAGSVRFAATAVQETEPDHSALRTSSARLHDSFFGAEATARIASEADAPVDQAAVLARLRKELETAGVEEWDVTLLGETLSADGRQRVTVTTPMGFGGGPSVRSANMVLPNVDDISRFLDETRKENFRVEKPEAMLEILEKFYQEKFLKKSAEHVAVDAAWGPKTLGDAEGEIGECAALMGQCLAAYRSALSCGGHVFTEHKDFQFEVQRTGDGRDCLVMPPSNFALLGLKDAVLNLLQGFRVLMVVQPRFFSTFKEVQLDLAECGLPHGLFEVLPGITPEADPAVLHEILRRVDRLQFTGGSAMFKSLVLKALELGNLRMEHAGEVSGLNKVRLDGVSASHPAALAGTVHAATANNGELCTSASLVEFDPATGDTAASVKAALESHTFRWGDTPEDATLNVLLKDGKTRALEVKTDGELQEWWEKIIYAVPQGGSPNTRTNQSLGHGIFAPSIDRALELGLKEEASCIYMVGVPEGSANGGVSARAGTTGAKVPQNVFGAMKSYTFAVAGDHDGVGSIQTTLSTVKRRGGGWRDQEERRADYELTEVAEMLTEFLSPREQTTFPQQISNVLEVYAAFEPKVGAPYDGQPLVGGEGRSQLVSLKALKSSRKNLLIPKGVGLSDEIVKMALLCEMSPLREVPVDLHMMDAPREGKLRITDPLKSFLRVVEKRLGWRVHFHADEAAMASFLRASEYPPYFFCVKDRHLLPFVVLQSVAEQGGYLYEGLPDDAIGLFRMLTTSQAWTVACTEAQVEEATVALQKAWKSVGLREEPHAAPELVQPTSRSAEAGGGFNAGFEPEDDKDWAELSSDDSSSSSSSSSDDEDKEDKKTKVAADEFTESKPAAQQKMTFHAAEDAKDAKPKE